MKKFLLILILFLLYSTSFAQTENAEPVIDNKNISQELLLKKVFEMPNRTVLAEVNGKKITKYTLMYELWNNSATNVLQSLIEQKILEEGFAKEEISVSQKEIDEEISSLLKQYNIKDLNTFLAQSRMPKDILYLQVSVQLSMKKIIDKFYTPDKEKLASYMKVSHILIKFDTNIENEIQRDEACKKKIDEIYAKVKAGEDFAKLAKEYSEDGSKENGGSLGWVDAKVNFVPEFKTAMTPLKAGEYTAPVKSQFGYHIIKMDKRGDTAEGKDLETLINKEKDQQGNKIFTNWYNNIVKDFNVVNYLIPAEEKKTEEPAK